MLSKYSERTLVSLSVLYLIFGYLVLMSQKTIRTCKVAF